MRERIGSQRFSVPGVPCLYLGKSVYTCWRELGQPNDSEFYVSRARINDEINIFNMAVNFDTLRHFCNCRDLKDNENFCIAMLKCGFYRLHVPLRLNNIIGSLNLNTLFPNCSCYR